ncbi:hypothetical protein VZT92_010643 [Zoarces viviparus]|uniref:Uncharacterized protein n=1 Tax=Zoarces viviparus TaxID=48416 RepID=A0AAW1F8G6_ZOAVI
MPAFHIGRGLADVASQSGNCAEREAEEKGGLSSSYGLQLVGRMMIPPPTHTPYPNRRYEINTNTAASRKSRIGDKLASPLGSGGEFPE